LPADPYGGSRRLIASCPTVLMAVMSSIIDWDTLSA
jgi:hypothetical protein